MHDWLDALSASAQSGVPAIMVTVAGTRGSTPRAASARMVITAQDQHDTIGGGHLEWRAIEMARAMLATPEGADTPQLHRIALGPALGQCCGGAVQLVFERYDAGHNPAVPLTATINALLEARRHGRDIWRIVPLQADMPPALRDHAPTAAGYASGQIGDTGKTHVAEDENGVATLYDLCRGERPQVVLFGAGHVGRAIVHILGTLNCTVTWIDQRDDMFPAVLPSNTDVEVTDTPEAVVRQAAPHSYFLVMTHSHAVDQQLSECILQRNDAAWFGLIGSATKRAQFISRLSQRGLSDAQIAGMTCPIGIGGITGKEPPSIALAVAAQLLQLWDSQPANATLPQPLQNRSSRPQNRQWK